MKKSKLISLMLLLVAGMISIQCTTDPIPGPPGTDGTDGTDGVSGIAECVACHNSATSEEVHASYLFSGHYNENMDHDVDGDGVMDPLSQYGIRGFGGLACTSCHTSDGFQDWTGMGAALGGGWPVYSGTQTITCNTCHGKHTSFDFENDGFDYALRAINPVTLAADDTYTIDYGKDEKSSHTCATCHQPRSVFPNPNENGKINVNGRFGPHYGAQSTLLEGIQGAEIAGYEYPEAKSAGHRTGSSCTSCHMGESTGNIDGLHTKIPTEATCATCHTNGVPTEVDGYEAAYKALEDLLLAEGILELDDNGETSIVSGEYDLIPAAALWNYRMLYYDHSHGVHNPVYAKALIQNSIDALNAN